MVGVEASLHFTDGLVPPLLALCAGLFIVQGPTRALDSAPRGAYAPLVWADRCWWCGA